MRASLIQATFGTPEHHSSCTQNPLMFCHDETHMPHSPFKSESIRLLHAAQVDLESGFNMHLRFPGGGILCPCQPMDSGGSPLHFMGFPVHCATSGDRPCQHQDSDVGLPRFLKALSNPVWSRLIRECLTEEEEEEEEEEGG